MHGDAIGAAVVGKLCEGYLKKVRYLSISLSLFTFFILYSLNRELCRKEGNRWDSDSGELLGMGLFITYEPFFLTLLSSFYAMKNVLAEVCSLSWVDRASTFRLNDIKIEENRSFDLCF